MSEEAPKEKHCIVTVDPGPKHLAAGIFKGTCSSDIKMSWWGLYKVETDAEEIASAAGEISYEASMRHAEFAGVEYQPPIPGRSPLLSRQNTFIEGGISVGLAANNIPVESVQPATYKRKLGLSTGDYKKNKTAVLVYARNHCLMPDGCTIPNDHLADCYAMAVYLFMKKFDKT